VGRFVAGFVTASLAWAVVLVLASEGLVPGFTASTAEPADAGVTEDAGTPAKAKRPRRRRRRRRAQRRQAAVPRGMATTGDELGGDEPRELDVGQAGGEEQLSSSQIERAMDGSFGRIRKCLVLAAGDEPVTGKLTFGLRIRADGTVSRVNLRGPAAVTTGDAGECLRNAARRTTFPSFNGPDMIAHYPITLE
jgi:hypothetical protein